MPFFGAGGNTNIMVKIERVSYYIDIEALTKAVTCEPVAIPTVRSHFFFGT